MDRKKKMVAAIAAVNAYIRADQESAFIAPTPQPRSPVWGMTGRLAQAQQRSMMQAIALK